MARYYLLESNRKNVTKPKMKSHDIIDSISCCLYTPNKIVSAMGYNIYKSQFFVSRQ